MVPGASFGECCTAPVAIRMVKGHVAVKGQKKNCMETPLARHQSATQVDSAFQMIKNIEVRGFERIWGLRKNRGAKSCKNVSSASDVFAIGGRG
jgi:hypothetical protein